MAEGIKAGFHHVPVMLEECISGLNIVRDGVYVDGTMGGAGHSRKIAERLSEAGTLIAIDRDGDAIDAGRERLKGYACDTRIIKGNFSCMKEIVRAEGFAGADGILLDLGVSSHQLDTPERGFTYRYEEAPLDMRMDALMPFTAKDILNGYPESELRRIIRDYGEDRFYARIARQIVLERSEAPLETAGDLVRAVKKAYPAKELRKPGHPAKKTFQAVRIELNGELKALEGGLRDMVSLLNDKGRICVITFHSLEDRIVKNIFRECENPCTCPPDFPVCVCGKKPLGRVISKKPVIPSQDEIGKNPRAKGAKLRVFERIKQ